jgi:hypothetical protein
MSSRDKKKTSKIGYVYTKKSSSKTITQIALDGEFTYSQGCTDDSSDSRITMLPSIAITQPSPSAIRRADCESSSRAQRDEDDTGHEKPASADQTNECESLPGKRKSYSVGSLMGRRIFETEHLPNRKNAQSEDSTHHRHQSVPNASSRGPLSSSSSDNKSSTMYFSGDDGRFTYKGILVPKITDNFPDSHLEAAYQKYSHRQRQKSLLILNLIDVVVKIAFFTALLIRIRDMSGRIRIPVQELVYLIPWIIGNSIIIGLITCSNKCANHYLHLSALLTVLLFLLESYLVFGLAAPSSLSAMGSSTGAVWYMIFVVFGIYSMMPLPLTWCIACSSASCVCDLLIMLITCSNRDHAFYRKVRLASWQLFCPEFHFINHSSEKRRQKIPCICILSCRQVMPEPHENVILNESDRDGAFPGICSLNARESSLFFCTTVKEKG